MLIARLGFAWVTLGAFLLFGGTWIHAEMSSMAAGALLLWLFVAMVWAAFGVIDEADALAEILGEPLGSLVLTLSIICLEGVLIGVAMLSSSSGATIGRDTLFGANMIMINLAGGLALFLGGLRHREQTYNMQGTSAYLAVVIVLSVIGAILPSYTQAIPRGSVTNVQAAGIMAVALFLYGILVLIQTGRHSHFFAEAEPAGGAQVSASGPPQPRSRDGVAKHALLLVAGLLPIVLLGKSLTALLDHATYKLGAPPALGGVIIALIVVSPKAISAVKAGIANQPQRAANLALGSCAPAMGVIFPIMLGIGIVTGKTVIMGVGPDEVILLAVTLVLSALTFSGPRTTLLEGAAHLSLFVMYIVLMFSP